MYRFRHIKTLPRWVAALSSLLAIYFMWANIQQVRTAHGAWVTDFREPRKLVGYADAVFVGRVVEQIRLDAAPLAFPQTQFRVEVMETVKSVRKLDPGSIASDKTRLHPLPSIVTVNQYGGRGRDATGKRTLFLMDGQPILEPGKLYLLATSYAADQKWFHLLPHGAEPISTNGGEQDVLAKFKKAKNEEILFTLKEIQGEGGDTPDVAPSNVDQSSTSSTTSTPDVSLPDLIDPSIPLATADDPAWQYRREAMADFDQDGVVERAFIIARVHVRDGRPLWDDGQPWQVYIEEPDGNRTYIYARYIQLGILEAILTQSQQTPGIVLIERAPQQLSIYEVRYEGPNNARVVELLRRELDYAKGFSGTPN